MDQEDLILGGLLAMGISGFVLVLGLFRAYADIRFALQGQRTIAVFTKFSKDRLPRGAKPNHKFVCYTFTDRAGHTFVGYDTVPLDWRAPADGKIEIVYYRKGTVDGQPRMVSRLQEKSCTRGVILVLAGIFSGMGSGAATAWAMLRAKPN